MDDYKTYERNKRAIRLYNSKRAKSRLLRKLSEYRYYKPSISAKLERGSDGELHYTGQIYRGKNSNRQKWMKKKSTKIIRNLKDNELIYRGNGHQKYYDYWWIWI